MKKLLAQWWENNITSFLIQHKEYLIHISQSITDQRERERSSTNSTRIIFNIALEEKRLLILE